MTPETTTLGAPDLTLAECCERWGVSSRNSIKARAAALGVELRRESSTRTVWPREDVPLGDELDQHLKTGGTLRDFPGALPQPAKPAPIAAAKSAAVTAAGGGSDALALAMLQLLQQQQNPAPGPLARSRAMAEAADERLPLTTPELAELVGLDADEVARLQAGTVLYGFRLARVGRRPSKKGQPDRRAWLLSRVVEGSEDAEDAVSGGTPVMALPAARPVKAKRAPGFIACLDAEATVLSRLELPRWGGQ
ncbi:hypothetical protein KBZ20_16345 [Vulcanococcus limneticus Candia 3F8]|uniref:hypothetical protein n=1 Tax=Vulcanococcus limneticus TaxID=2170428 RepID=UPI0020CF8652|nr:hypothetical protein [Vulcanococcus limneticus]MCP9793335.1 hypothetical protein [Vulcanococcus limneticus MW73D5]MCP9895337.1 hypothetical protein [Vulcanococcus limneticus Candia 3F8]MCP9898733.1 hypothetical protein [Vulcanococcus limneticus Candia 3B3]